MAVVGSSDQTFKQLYNRLLVYSPELPLPLAMEFINTAYSRLLAHHRWSSLKQDNIFVVPDPYSTGGVTITQGTTAVTGVGTVWTSAMVGRQLIVGDEAPFYDIISINVGAQTMVIGQSFGQASVINATYSIEGVYLTPPADFVGFKTIRDPNNNWRLHTNFSQEQVDIWDPKRTVSGTPWVVVNAPQDVNGNRRFEIWPRPTSNRYYPYRYIARPALLSAADDKPIFPIRGDVIREGALAELAMWPGTTTYKNPYYDLVQHRLHEERFWKYAQGNVLQDEDIDQQAIKYEDLHSVPYAPIDAKYLQTHDLPF